MKMYHDDTHTKEEKSLAQNISRDYFQVLGL